MKLLLVSAFLTLGFCYNDAFAQQPTNATLINSVQNFENQYLVCSFRFASDEIYLNGPAWPGGTTVNRGSGLWRSNSKSEVHIERVISYKDLYQSIAYEIPVGVDPSDIPDRHEECLGFVYSEDSSVSVNGRGQRFFPSGTIKSNQRDAKWRLCAGHLSFLFGYELYQGQIGHDKFSNMLASRKFSVEKASLSGKNCWQVSCQTNTGLLQIWFSMGAEHLPLQFNLRRGAADFLWRGVRPLQVCDSPGYCFGGKPKPARSGVTIQYKNLEYVKINGKFYCNGFEFEIQENFTDGRESRSVANFEITDINLDEPKISPYSFEFSMFSIPDKTSFRAEDALRIPYVISDGKICKVIDENTLESLEGIRFAMPKARKWWLWLACSAVVALASGYFWRKTRGGNHPKPSRSKQR